MCRPRKTMGRIYDLLPQCGQNLAAATGLGWPQLRQEEPPRPLAAPRPVAAPFAAGRWRANICTVSVSWLILACKSSPPAPWPPPPPYAPGGERAPAPARPPGPGDAARAPGPVLGILPPGPGEGARRIAPPVGPGLGARMLLPTPPAEGGERMPGLGARRAEEDGPPALGGDSWPGRPAMPTRGCMPPLLPGRCEGGDCCW